MTNRKSRKTLSLDNTVCGHGIRSILRYFRRPATSETEIRRARGGEGFLIMLDESEEEEARVGSAHLSPPFPPLYERSIAERVLFDLKVIEDLSVYGSA